MASRKKGIKPERLAEAAAELLHAFQNAQQRWLKPPKLPMSKELAVAARKELVKQQRIVEVGSLERATHFSVVRQSTPKEHLIALAEAVIFERGMGRGLVLVSLSKKHKGYKAVPGKVKDQIVSAARRLVDARRAFFAQAGQTKWILLADNMAALLQLAPVAASTNEESVRGEAGSLDPIRVVEAYARLSRERRSPHVIVSDLQREAGVPLEPLKEWLLSECRAHRAIPFLGEPARATEEQLAAALVVGGQHHLYVRLVEEGLS